MKEEYENLAFILKKINYAGHNWLICVDLKMVNFLLGQQGWYTKYPCFLCLWDCRQKGYHWIERNWSLRENMVVGKRNVIQEPLIRRNRIILPVLHIKLGLMKQFIRALDKNRSCLQYVVQKIVGINLGKIKAGIFNVP